MRLGIYLYGMATVAAGIMVLVWDDFEAAHQPIQAFGDHIPGREIFAYITAVWLIAGGAAILWRRAARAGAAAVALIYFVFAVVWLPRFYTAPHALGFRIPVDGNRTTSAGRLKRNDRRGTGTTRRADTPPRGTRRPHHAASNSGASWDTPRARGRRPK